MPRPADQHHARRATRADLLPPGTPKWITMDLVKKTIEVWQPHYEQKISLDDAVTILTRVGQLFSVLLEK